MILKIDPVKLWSRLSGALGAGTALKSGKLNTTGFKTISGELFADGTQATATLVVNHMDSNGNVLYADSVAVDGSQTASTYSWDLPLKASYVQVIFTSQGAATVVRAYAELEP